MQLGSRLPGADRDSGAIRITRVASSGEYSGWVPVLIVVAPAVLLALYVIPGGWGYALVAVAVLLTTAEGLLIRSTRRIPLAAGVETMIGGRAIVLTSCRPAGRVKYRRESWKARCTGEAEADVGDTVVITSVENTTLVISPAPEPTGD
jgi:membrane protein implicated in regulation of membrane protease activity